MYDSNDPASRQLKASWQPPFTWLFLGPRGCQTRLHVDVWHTDAWLSMLEGRGALVHWLTFQLTLSALFAG